MKRQYQPRSFLGGIFPLFPLFPLFFDGTERQYDRKYGLAVKVRSLKAGLSLKYSTNVLFMQRESITKRVVVNICRTMVKTIFD